MFWRTMFVSPLFAVVIAILIAWLRPDGARGGGACCSRFGCWRPRSRVVRPSHFVRASRFYDPRTRTTAVARAQDVALLRSIRRPNDQWLPIDNYQEPPHEQTAHRTSPTNIGLMLVATLSAYDFGYIGPLELSLRTRRAFDSVARLPHYRGHLLNWYDTKNLQALRAALRIDRRQRQLRRLPGRAQARLQGDRDRSRRACRGVGRLARFARPARGSRRIGQSDAAVPMHDVRSLMAVIERMRREVVRGRANPKMHTRHCERSATTPRPSSIASCSAFSRAERNATTSKYCMRFARRSSDCTNSCSRCAAELDMLMPWLAMTNEAAARAIELPNQIRLDQIAPGVRTVARTIVSMGVRATPRRRAHCGASGFRRAGLKRRCVARRKTRPRCMPSCSRSPRSAEEEVRGMDFKLLFDTERKLFHIGYNATLDQVDSHYYDLLTSEARLASYIAIVKRDVPQTHWYALGRPMTNVNGAPALLSWGGTMFEYLMPELLMRSQQGTLLAQTCELAVAAQIAHARHAQEPWGISESAYARLDAHQTYQYRSFGVPGLGFKRGLENDRVIAPYASMLAVSTQPRAVVENLRRLESMGMLGAYGLYEALDFTAERAPEGKPFAIVRSYMAHHQGMLLIALGNQLNERSMVDRFHSDAVIETGEILLNEHAPLRAPAEWPLAETPAGAVVPGVELAPHPPAPWSPAAQTHPQAFVLSNGRLTSLLTAAGGGGLSWQGLALTRYQPDPTRDDDGLWIYVRDEDSGRVWLATSAEGRTTFAMHEAEFHRRHEGISIHVDVAVAPADDVEVRQIILHNESGRPRRLTVTQRWSACPVRREAGPDASSVLQHVRAQRVSRRPQRATFHASATILQRAFRVARASARA